MNQTILIALIAIAISLINICFMVFYVFVFYRRNRKPKSWEVLYRYRIPKIITTGLSVEEVEKIVKEVLDEHFEKGEIITEKTSAKD